MRRYLRPSAVNDPVSAWGLYKSDDDQTHSDDLCCGLCCLGGRRGRNFARAGATGLSGASRSLIRPRQQPYPPADYRRGSGRPDFDGLDDEDGPNAQSSTALPPPGPVLSPDDPRYGRPMDAPPVYSDRAMPTGPVLSPDDPALWPSDGCSAGLFRPHRADRSGPFPDDPRYGRPAGPPPQTYSDRDMRPPGSVGAPGATGTVQPPLGPDGRPDGVVRAAGDEQPEVGPAQLPPNLRRQEVAFAPRSPRER